MFSSRLPAAFGPNALAAAVDRLRTSRTPFIDLTVTNPTAVGIAYPPDLLSELSSAPALKYQPEPLGIVSAREAVSREFARQNAEVPPDRVVLTASSSEAYSLLFKLLCDPGDSVLVPRPSYPLFDHLTRLEGVNAERYELTYEGQWAIDLDSLADRVGPHTRAVLVVNPNNPTGNLMTGGELEALAALCAERSIALIGDEVFADYLWNDKARLVSVLDQHAALAFGLGGLSKSAGLPQMKLGWMAVSGPARVVDDAMARLELIADTYLSVSTPVQDAAGDLIACGAAVRRQIQERVRANAASVGALLASHPGCDMLSAEAGWYVVVRVPALVEEEELVRSLLTKHGVLVHPGFFYDFPSEAFLVASLLPSSEVLLPALAKVLDHASGCAA